LTGVNKAVLTDLPEMQNYKDVTIEITVSLIVPSSGGGTGGGGFIIPPATPAIPAGSGVSINYTQSGETVTLDMPDSKINEIINSAKDGTVVIDASEVSGATDIEMSKSALTKLADAGLDVKINLPQGDVTLDADAAKSVAAQAGGSSVKITVKEVSQSSLTKEQRAAINPNDLVFDITVMSDSQVIHNFDGTITVTVPYDGELPVAVWYLSDNGELEEIPCVYDEMTKTVSFTTGHLSLYVIGQDRSKLPAQEWENPFVDVKSSDWFYRDVEYVVTNGLMLGTSTEPMLFSPNMALTRGMVVTVLYRIAGTPDVSGLPNPFDDVDDGKWYTDAIKWATSNGIVSGYGDGKFGPEDNITREQLAVMIINYQKYSGKKPSDVYTEREFADNDDISRWAKNAVKKLTMQGIISGKPGNMFDPKGEATRAEFAAMLHRFLEEVK